MPNIRGKVAWVPEQHSWKVEVRKANSEDSFEFFKVSPDLPLGMYADTKFDAYTRAICAWNALDKTKRYRIPMPGHSSATTADSALASTGIPGPQPTCGNASGNVLNT